MILAPEKTTHKNPSLIRIEKVAPLSQHRNTWHIFWRLSNELKFSGVNHGVYWIWKCISYRLRPNFVIKVKSVTPQRVYLQPVASVSFQEKVYLVSDIHKQIWSQKSTTNIQPITLDFSGTNSSSLFQVLATGDIYINAPFLNWD